MATLDRQLLSLDTFLSKPWSVFIDAAKLHHTHNFFIENHGKQLLNSGEGTKLNKEDMHLYGQFPTHEDFSLVICNVCNQVVKPQGLLTHYQKRHGSPGSSKTPLVPMKPKMSLSQSDVDALPFRVPRDYPHSRFNKAPLAVYPPKGARAKACVSLPVVSLEKMPCFSRTEGAHVKVNSTSSNSGTSLSSSSSASSSPSSTSTIKSSHTSQASHKAQDKFLNGRGPATPRSITPPSSIDRRPSPSRSPLDKRPAPSPSSVDRRPNASPSPSSLDKRPNVSPLPVPLDRKPPSTAKGNRHKRVSGRVFDPNKHCGVLDPETRKPCTRSLTCKTHSLTHRRAVPGRRKDFDILLAEHKGRAKEKEAGHKRDPTAANQAAQMVQSHDTTSTVPSSCHNGKTTPTLKLRLANAHVNRTSGGGGAVVLSSMSVPAPEPVASWQRPLGDERLSSDEGEAELPEEAERAYCHYATRHPRPMSCCTFNSRLMGRGHYVFDRRWDRMRLAVHCMVEKHVNSQMWKKVPLAAESVLSVSPSASEVSPSLGSPLIPTPGLTPALDGVSMVSYSTAFPHNGAGVFCIRDPDPGLKLPRTKLSRSPRGSGEGAKKRKPPPTPVMGSCGSKNGNGYNPPGPAPISNGTAALSVKARPLGRGGQGPRDSDRYGSMELGLPQALTGEHGVSFPHSTLPCGLTEGRKRKSSGSSERTSKMSKTMGMDGMLRKNSASLPSSVPETPHGPLSRQPKIHH
ncbi:ataxin-7-like protein 1 [Chanos chanos]|uniref:Ataxin-7-like protein 1 n=1 Tax=Chanos chanos TaxID=29144 RepID=A0A6J2VIY5_CHACN|nr:ataxin-7-like protein 1 [Chanos chanos]